MKRYTQIETGDKGNCFATCIACLLELDPATVPNLCFLADNWREATNKWLARRGLFYMDVGLQPDQRSELAQFWGWHVISGESPRGKRHSVVGYGGEIIHDPHPDQSGLIGKPEDWEYGFLISIEPTRRKP